MGNGSVAQHNADQLGRQILPGASGFLKDCLTKARLKSSHCHLLISTGAETAPIHVRSGILPGDPAQAFYVQSGEVTTPAYDALKKHAEENKKTQDRSEAGAGTQAGIPGHYPY
jgi:hypothetical protein